MLIYPIQRYLKDTFCETKIKLELIWSETTLACKFVDAGVSNKYKSFTSKGEAKFDAKCQICNKIILNYDTVNHTENLK